MTLENIYYIGQTVAVVAIFASLVAIYFQQRQQVQQANAEAARDALSKYQSCFELLSADPAYARMVRVSAFHWEKLSDNQKFLTHIFWWKLASTAENVLYYSTIKLGETKSYAEVESITIGMIRMPGVRSWWENAKYFCGAEFREAVDARLADERNLPPSWAVSALWLVSDEDLQIVLSSEGRHADADPKPDNEVGT